MVNVEIISIWYQELASGSNHEPLAIKQHNLKQPATNKTASLDQVAAPLSKPMTKQGHQVTKVYLPQHIGKDTINHAAGPKCISSHLTKFPHMIISQNQELYNYTSGPARVNCCCEETYEKPNLWVRI
jgi:hypothetical protein